MNTIYKVGAASLLALGYASAHAGITASKSSSTPGDLLLFAEVVQGTTVEGYYVGDTKVAVGGLNPASNLTNGSLIQTSGDVNLNTLLSLTGTLEWAVEGGGFDSSFNASVLTTVTPGDLSQLESRNNTSVGSFMINGGISPLIGNTLNGLVGAGSSYEGTTSTKWDTTGATPAGSNAEYWFNNGTQTAQTGFGSATLYSVIAAAGDLVARQRAHGPRRDQPPQVREAGLSRPLRTQILIQI
jgi:hypothetical protein